MINNKKPPYTQEEEVEEIRKQRYLKQLDYWKNRTEMFTIVETIPSVPVVEEKDYKNIIKNLDAFLGVWVDYENDKTYGYFKYDNKFIEDVYLILYEI